MTRDTDIDKVRITVSSSAGMGMAQKAGIDFIQEVFATGEVVSKLAPETGVVIELGGEDVKVIFFDGGVDERMNGTCAGGTGSFIDQMAVLLNMTVDEMDEESLKATRIYPIASHCGVFAKTNIQPLLNQGASVEDISAGLSISVVKNALYKVIRTADPKQLGRKIVVQGGTFYNDAVLRAFEKEIGASVIRPSIAGLMGAYGAALYAMNCHETNLLNIQQLKDFSHKSATAVCKGCTNHCHLTINTFADGGKFISGNRCEKGLGIKEESLPNLYETKRNYFENLSVSNGGKIEIGIPLALSSFELAPLWKGIFTYLGYDMHFSHLSNRATYEKGQFTIPSDTVCYPAKITHGHIMELLEEDLDAVFYPQLTYNIDEHDGDNHYNCPVVAYYSELLSGNIEQLKNTVFLHPSLSLGTCCHFAADN